MASWEKYYANQTMFENFMKIVREEMVDVQFVFESNRDNDNSIYDVYEPPAKKIARRDPRKGPSHSGDGRIIKIPAHKKVLAASSSIFSAMFNGPLKETGDVQIVDVSSHAFREFLQIFYNNKVKLTLDNLNEVMVLVDKYDVEAGWPIVEQFFKDNLDLADILWFLHLAVKFRRDNLIALCSTTIENSTAKVCDMFEIGDSGKPKFIGLNTSKRQIADNDLAMIFSHVFMATKRYVLESVPAKDAGVVSLKLQPSCVIFFDTLQMQDISFTSNRPLLLTRITFTSLPKRYCVKVCIDNKEHCHNMANGKTMKYVNPIPIQPNQKYTIQTKHTVAIPRNVLNPLIISYKTTSEPVLLAANIQITFDNVHSQSIVAAMDFLRYDY